MQVSLNKNWTACLLAFAIVFCLSSCIDDNVVFEENLEVENAVWKRESNAKFVFEVKDTLTNYDFYINLRNGSEYKYNNIFMFLEIAYPNGKRRVDTLECSLCDPQGNWYGSGFGKIFDNRFLYQRNMRLPLPGKYKVEINQAMREEDLEEIYDVGFRVSKAG